MVMRMSRGLGDGLLRRCNGAWRDDDGDPVDIVEVVRCKDCKRFVVNKEAVTSYCTRGLQNTYAKPDDFCSYGERKENEDGYVRFY